MGFTVNYSHIRKLGARRTNLFKSHDLIHSLYKVIFLIRCFEVINMPTIHWQIKVIQKKHLSPEIRSNSPLLL